MAKMLKITQTRSVIDRPKDQKRTIEALGLGRPNWFRVHGDTPQIRGMARKVSHLVTVEEIDAKQAEAPAPNEKKTTPSETSAE
ncbi:MAG: 50S ribosomal protein L30 [Ignavibacteriales bacterium]|nr:50S ribosomal protein L30 [Ignavibacteriales bacterium]